MTQKSDFATTAQTEREGRPTGKGSMRDQLNKFKNDNSLKSVRRTPVAHRTAVTDWRGDGIDHVNISTSGKTAIGQFLAHNSDNAVVSPIFGRFPNVRALWMWLLSPDRDDRYRTRGHNGSRGQNGPRRQVPNFRAIILSTDWNKLKQYPAAAEALRTSTMPLDTYFYDTESTINMPRRPTTFYWLVSGWEELRRALREEREPDLTPWLDVAGSDIYEFAFNQNGAIPGVIEKASQNKRVKRFVQGAAPVPRNRKPNVTATHVVELAEQNASVDASADSLLASEVSVITIDNPQVEESPASDVGIIETLNPDAMEETQQPETEVQQPETDPAKAPGLGTIVEREIATQRLANGENAQHNSMSAAFANALTQ